MLRQSLRASMLVLIFAALALIRVQSARAVGEASTKFGIFVPASAVVSRDGTLIVTAMQDGTLVDIYDDGTDGDTDDTATGIALNTGQSYIIYIWEGAVNDDGQHTNPKKDGDFFLIKSTKPVIAASLTVNTDWQHDFVPADNRRMTGTSFYLYRPPGLTTSGSVNDILDIFAYNDNTSIKIIDITATAKTTSGATSVVSDAAGTLIFSTTLNAGQDLLEVKRQKPTLVAGRTYHIISNKDVSVMFGALGQGRSASRDGGAYVPGKNGYSADKTFYFIIPSAYKRPTDVADERELRLAAFEQPANITIRGWNTKTNSWDTVARYPLAAFGHAELIGTTLGSFLDTDGLYRNYFLYEVTSDATITIFETNWLETGNYGTSDIAMYISSETGTGSGTSFLAYMGPPGTAADGIQKSHLIIAAHQAANVQVYDPDSYGEYIELYNPSNQTVSLANWTITNLDNWQIVLPTNASIAAKSTYLLEYHERATNAPANFVYGNAYPNFHLRNDADTLVLRKPDNSASDTLAYTDAPAWGLHGIFHSLERLNPNTSFVSSNARDSQTYVAKASTNLGEYYGSPGTHQGAAGSGTGNVGINEVMTGRIYQKFSLAANGYREVALTVAEWEGIRNGEKPGTRNGNPENPYLIVKADKPVNVMDGNWNDNWLAYGTGILQPDPYVTYQADYYQRRVGQQVTWTAYAYNVYGALYNPQTKITIPNGVNYSPGNYASPSQLSGVTPTQVQNADGSWTLTWNHAQTMDAGQVYRFQVWGTLANGLSAGTLLPSTVIVQGNDVGNVDKYSSQDTATVNVAASDEVATLREVVINEVLPNPIAGFPWIEIHNRGTSDINIGGWQLANDAAFTYTFPANTFIGNDAYLVLFLGAGTNTATEFYAGAGTASLLNANLDQLALYSSSTHNSNTLLDFVEWSATAATTGRDALAISAGQWSAGNVVASPAQQQSLGRDRNATDNHLSADWDNTGGADAVAATRGAINVTIAGADVTPPNAVTNLLATGILGEQGVLHLTWTNPPDADLAGVKIIRSITNYPASLLDGLEIYDGMGGNATDAGLTPGALVYYAAFAYDRAGNFAWTPDTAKARAIVPQRIHLTYEDQKGVGWSDWDSNDLVVQQDSTVQLNAQGITLIATQFTAEARGSAYDHQLNLRMPIGGAANITIQRYNSAGALIATENTSAQDVVNVEIFSHTKTALPPNPGQITANVVQGVTRQPGMSTRVTITLLDPAANPPDTALLPPFDPWLHVWDTNADIHLMSAGALGNTQRVSYAGPLQGRDLPFALTFNETWGWPIELTPIWGAYPQYTTFITSGNQLATNWFASPDVSKIWTNAGGTFKPRLPAQGKTDPRLALARKPRATTLPGFPKSTGGPIYSSPLIVDLNGDGANELIVASEDRNVYVWKSDGTALSGWHKSATDAIRSSPAVGDVAGDGGLEVVIGSNDGKVYVWHANGNVVPGFPVTLGAAIKSSPALADLDGDAKKEIIVHANDGKVYVVRGNGSAFPGFPQSAGNVAEQFGNFIIASTPAVGQVDTDGRPAIVVAGTDGKVYAWHADGTKLTSLWPRATNTMLTASPIIVDLNNDGYRDIVVASGDGWVSAWRGDGKPYPGFPVRVGSAIIGSPAIADLDRNGSLEIVVVTMQGRLVVLDASGNVIPGFPKNLGATVYGSPILADMDGDSDYEIIVGSHAGTLRAWHGDGYEVTTETTPGIEWPKPVNDWIVSAPVVGDLNNDDKIEIAIGSHNGQVFVWSEMFGAYNAADIANGWYAFHRNPERTGLIGASAPTLPFPPIGLFYFPSVSKTGNPPSSPVIPGRVITTTLPVITR